MSPATRAGLLASKSNYQHLLEGNHIHGVKHPRSLSVGVNWKRSSSQIAEKGRRDRINDALKEMQSLISRRTNLSKSLSNETNVVEEDAAGVGAVDKVADRKSKKGKDVEASVKRSNTKAATVEIANEYIKEMQKDNAKQIANILQLEKENETLRRELAEMNGQGK